MRIALHDADSHNFPNLALMKLSAYHKSKGDIVEWYNPLLKYDLVYASKVFTFTKDNTPLPDNAIKGGTGYGNYNLNLSHDIEHIMPDYSLYNLDYSLGFTTRGCPNNCAWCIVPKKEGKLRKHAYLKEFLAHKQCVLMDNNILACKHGLNQLYTASKLGIKIDCNQGLDARIVASDLTVARLLAKCKWITYIRFACDTMEQIAPVEKAVKLVRQFSKRKGRFWCYVLMQDMASTIERVEFLRSLNVSPFVQPYRDFTNNNEIAPEFKHYARYVNNKFIFNSCTWQEYKYNKGA